jgi:glycosyltransferase involved in cell wall biosynthesis
MKPFLSILIPTRNRCEYLKYTIQSAINLPSNEIEIIVSENFSLDASLDVCNSFSDGRLSVVRPTKPLSMHENFEFLLKQSSGEWVIFVGDDDAVMPHCMEHLKYLCNKYPQAEAILSPRAYYFWDGCQEEYGAVSADFAFNLGEQWKDSKKQLQLCLNGNLDYINLPQMYSGGFHRRSLINRVLRAQNGQYFKSVTPDAYTALMACIFTYRYLETGVPMTWVGSSPHQALKAGKSSSKDRDADFFKMHSGDSLTINKTLGDLKVFTFTLVFYEAFISAFPLTPYSELSRDKVRSLYLDAVMKLRSRGDEAAVTKLAGELGFDVPPRNSVYLFLLNFYKRIMRKLVREFTCTKNHFFTKIRKAPFTPVFKYTSHSHQDHPDILACDSLLSEGYSKWIKINNTRVLKK